MKIEALLDDARGGLVERVSVSDDLHGNLFTVNNKRIRRRVPP